MGSPTRSPRRWRIGCRSARGRFTGISPASGDLFLAAADRVMRKMQERVDANIAGIDDGLERITRAITTFLGFFAEHPPFVELLIQERAYFKDRKRPTYFEHRDVNIERWRQLYRDLIAAGADPRHARRADHECRQQRGLRDHGHQLFQRSAQALRMCRRRRSSTSSSCGILTESERQRRGAEANGPTECLREAAGLIGRI